MLLLLNRLALSLDLLFSLAHAALLLCLGLALTTVFCIGLTLAGCCLRSALLLRCLFALPRSHLLTLARLRLLLTLSCSLLFAGTSGLLSLSSLSVDLLLTLALSGNLRFAGDKVSAALSLSLLLLLALHYLFVLAFC